MITNENHLNTIGIHTMLKKTYFPVNVSTFDMHNFEVPHPEVGIIDGTLFTKKT